MGVSEQQTVSSQCINIRRLNARHTIATEVAITKVVGNNQDDIWFLWHTESDVSIATSTTCQCRCTKPKFTPQSDVLH